MPACAHIVAARARAIEQSVRPTREFPKVTGDGTAHQRRWAMEHTQSRIGDMSAPAIAHAYWHSADCMTLFAMMASGFLSEPSGHPSVGPVFGGARRRSAYGTGSPVS
jgi:hypothetical protein